MVRFPHARLKQINLGLFLLIILLDAYVIGAPLLPAVLARPQPASSPKAATYSRKLQTTTPAAGTTQPAQVNQLIIPTLQLDQPIYEGTDTYAELAKGIWRWPGSSTPDQGSNTVLLGHRFTYTNPRGVFYFLNLLKAGDEIGVVWRNVTYTYVVYQTEVVTPSHTEILDPTTQPTLTMYTCTPTWWPVNRLVVQAHLERHS
jgi:LPXTG-site transpeptidase (sortase) family protein